MLLFHIFARLYAHTREKLFQLTDMQVKVTYRRTSRLSMRIGKDGNVNISAPYLTSRSEIERFVKEHEDWIIKTKAKVTAQIETRDAFYGQLVLRTKAQRMEAISRLDATVSPMVMKYAALMGVKPKEISYKATKSRWGACNPRTGQIQFSTYLLQLPEDCIEHAVVHELAHLIVPNHSAGFYAVMDRYFPDWKECTKRTRQICSRPSSNK